MENEIIQAVTVEQPDMLAALNKSEVDMLVATAHQYPRNVHNALVNIEALATSDPDTANECFYVLRRKNADGSVQMIEGLSVRMAEIIASCWGNMMVATRIIGNDGKKITSQAVCVDLESNVRVSVEVQRRITNKYGKTFSEDMQVVTGNAASAIAFRNAVLKVVPKAMTKRIITHIKEVSLGQSLDMETSRSNMLAYFAKLGVDKDTILAYLEIDSVELINKEMVFELRGIANAIKEGTTSVQETFIQPMVEKKTADAAKKAAEEAKDKANAALARQAENKPTSGKSKTADKPSEPAK